MISGEHLRVHPLAPIVALDIDGTLADYYGHFQWFAEIYLQEKLHVDWTHSDEFSEALHVDKDVYRDIKLAYRQGGMKRSIPLIDSGAHDVVQAIRGLGIQVWITTTRPWNRLDNVDPDTRFWIERNLGRVDGLIYGEDKYLDLIDIVGDHERILGIVDDLPENTTRAHRLELSAMLRAGEHNKRFRKLAPSRMGQRGPKPAVANHSIDIYNQVAAWKGIWDNNGYRR